MTAALQSCLDLFIKDMKRHEIFIKLESKISNPVSPISRPRSETLLSAYVSLSCGRFERFLQDSFYEAADDLRIRIGTSNDPRIIKVDTFYWQNLNGFLQWAAHARGIDRVDIISKIQSFSQCVTNGGIFPESFKYTHANPNVETLKAMLGRFGIESGFRKLSAVYIDSRNRSFSQTLIESSLTSFVSRRHQAAHLGRIPGMTRADARDDHVFIVGLAAAVKTVLAAHVAQIA